MTKKEFFKSKTEEEQKDYLKKWFLNNYEDPANCCPWEDGEYVYIWGGPYDAREELEEHFSGFVSEQVINDVIDELENISYEWSDIPENDEELDYYIKTSDDPYSNYLKAEKEIYELINDNVKNTKNLYKMLYAQSISAMEQFLSSYFIWNIKNDTTKCIVFIQSCEELKKVKLEDFALSKLTINEFVCKYILEKVVWHKFKIIKPFYNKVLNIDFPEDLSTIHQGIEIRHHIVHRNGKDFEGNEIEINKNGVVSLLNEITKFVEKIIDIKF